jgi:nucleoside-diphosphate-sugar epimerase
LRTLIIGGAGYVGPVVLDCLRRSDPAAQIHGLDAGWFADQCDPHGPLPETRYDAFRLQDVRDVAQDDLRGFSHVVYLAAISNDPMGGRFARLTEEINHYQAVRVATFAKAEGALGFVYASSASVYGHADTVRTELTPPNPQTDYARSKLAAESGLAALATRDFHITCLRFATACGWSPRVRLDLVLNDFVASAITTGRIRMLSDGSAFRPLVHVQDMAKAVLWAINREAVLTDSFVCVNVGSDEWNYRIKDLAHAVAAQIDESVVVDTGAAADNRNYRVDFALWRALAPYHQPTTTLTQAVEELADNFRLLPDLTSDFRASHRVRLVRLEQLIEQGQLTKNLRWQVR